MTEPTRRTLVIATALALIVAVAVAGLIYRSGVGDGAATTGTTYDFGKVVEGQVVDHIFTLPNPGATDLVIARVTPTASTVTHVDSTLPAGGGGGIALRLPTDRRRGAVGEVVRVEFASGDKPVYLTLRGRVVPAIEFSPQDRVYFFTVAGEPAREEVLITNHRDPPLSITGTRSSSPLFRPDVETVEAGRRYRVIVTLDSSTPVGRHHGAITLATDAPEAPTLAVEARAFVHDVVSLSLTRVDYQRIDFEALNRTAVARRTIRVQRHRGTDFRVLGASTDVPFLSTQVETEQPGASYFVHVRIVQARAPRGAIAGTLVIETNDPTAREIRLPISGEIL